MVEFALSITLVLTIFCAIFEFSWVLYNYAYLNNTVSKAARLAVPTANTGANDDTAIRTFIANAKGGLPIAAPTITCTDQSGNSTTNRTPGNIVTVTATINYTSVTPLSGLIAMAGFNTLRSSCSVVLE